MDGFERLDLASAFGVGPQEGGLPPGWILAEAETLWRDGDLSFLADLDVIPGPNWWAWRKWGRPG